MKPSRQVFLDLSPALHLPVKIAEAHSRLGGTDNEQK
jgi:hypothetical protein